MDFILVSLRVVLVCSPIVPILFLPFISAHFERHYANGHIVCRPRQNGAESDVFSQVNRLLSTTTNVHRKRLAVFPVHDVPSYKHKMPHDHARMILKKKADEWLL